MNTRFQCPICWQKYDVPPVSIAQIRAHMHERHNSRVSIDWVNARLKNYQ